MKTLFSNGNVLWWNETAWQVDRTNVLVDGDKIVAIGRELRADSDTKEIDIKNKLLMPGLINAHTHAYMSIMRSLADDVPFTTWLKDTIEPMEDQLTIDDMMAGTTLSVAEMLRTGTTCFVDMHMCPRVVPEVSKAVGIRAVVGRGLVGQDFYTDARARIEQAVAEYDTYKKEALVTFMLAPHALYSCSSTVLKSVAQLAREMNLPLMTHLAESEWESHYCAERYHCTPTQHMERQGVLDVPCLLAHCVNLNEFDRAILAKKGAAVVTCPVSNCKLGNGFADIDACVKAGINVCIGTDGPASNNSQNLFREMNFLALIAKGQSKQADTLSADEILKMATVNAGKALGLPIGNVVVGNLADLIVLDMTLPEMIPGVNVVKNLIYSAYGTEVVHTMVGGRILMKDGALLTIDMEETANGVNEVVRRLTK